MWIPQTSPLLNLDDMFFSLCALSGDLCLLAKIWWPMWCCHGQCLVLDCIWLTPVKIQVSARTTSTAPAAWVLTCERKCVGELGLTLLSQPMTCPGAAVQQLPFLPWDHLSERILVCGWQCQKDRLVVMWRFTGGQRLRLWRVTSAVLCGHLPTWHWVKPETMSIQNSNQQQ